MRKAEKKDAQGTIEAGEIKETAPAVKTRKPSAAKKTIKKSEAKSAPSDAPAERLAAIGDTVTVYYTGTLDKGSTFDTADEQNPLVFTIGANTVFPKLEYSVVGMKVNQRTVVRLTPTEGFGFWRKDNVITVERTTFPADEEIVVGKKAKVAYSGGTERLMQVIEVTDSEVKLDANHPLAGLFLSYDLMLAAIE
jgi:FKBP-type peptidyl-prolyl cis-trans isomerase 2